MCEFCFILSSKMHCICYLVAVLFIISGIFNTGQSQMAKPEEEEQSLGGEERNTNIPPPDSQEVFNLAGMPEEAVPFSSQVAGHSDHSQNCTVGKFVQYLNFCLCCHVFYYIVAENINAVLMFLLYALVSEFSLNNMSTCN